MLVRRDFSRQPAASVGGTTHAVTIGNFDGVHLGHQAILAEVKAAAARLGIPSCVVTFEPHPRELFSPLSAPTRLSSLREKCELLFEHGIDRVQVLRFNRAFANLSADEFIDRVLVKGLNAKWVMIGDDFCFGAKRSGDLAHLKRAGDALGFEVHAMHTVKAGEGENAMRVSSSAVREILSGGDVGRAAKLLGRPYSISGRVVHGDKLGRQLGWPTANVELRHNRPPLTGIYAVRVGGLGPKALDGVASLGIRPTVTNSGLVKLEVYIFDFDQDIYGKHIRVDFLKKIRDEEKFPDLDSLKKQIAQDADDARRFLETLN
ncbi:MAG: riboflavin kinase [Betaproteobacteria bacterium]|nr:riboflavin kinase [Betaproteobacteria bacterium]